MLGSRKDCPGCWANVSFSPLLTLVIWKNAVWRYDKEAEWTPIKAGGSLRALTETFAINFQVSQPRRRQMQRVEKIQDLLEHMSLHPATAGAQRAYLCTLPSTTPLSRMDVNPCRSHPLEAPQWRHGAKQCWTSTHAIGVKCWWKSADHKPHVHLDISHFLSVFPTPTLIYCFPCRYQVRTLLLLLHTVRDKDPTHMSLPSSCAEQLW